MGGLLDRTQARWVTWDFNPDPGDGCARADHGHHADDGLLQHYRASTPCSTRCGPGTRHRLGGLLLRRPAHRRRPGRARARLFLSDPDWTEHALSCGHLARHAAEIRPLLADGVLRPLTPQPSREGKGQRQPAFQLSADDADVVAGCRLPPAPSWQPVRRRGLDPDAAYAVRAVEGVAPVGAVLRGDRDLLEQGLQPAGPATSALWLVARTAAG